MTKMMIIDNDTQAELAELGMSTKISRVICRDCRFRNARHHVDFVHYEDTCLVYGRKRCDEVNPDGLCDRFEALVAAKPSQMTTTGLELMLIGAIIVVAALIHLIQS